MNSFHHERPAPPNFPSLLGITQNLLGTEPARTKPISSEVRASAKNHLSGRALESAASRITRDFSDPVPLNANEPKLFKLQFDDRHVGRQINGFRASKSNSGENRRETEGSKYLIWSDRSYSCIFIDLWNIQVRESFWDCLPASLRFHWAILTRSLRHRSSLEDRCRPSREEVDQSIGAKMSVQDV